MAAKPDLTDGWLPYAHELDAALAVADFTKGARLVLREVFAQIFGMAKLKSATLSPSGIASVAGMMREHVSRAIKELVDSGVLVRLGDGTYRFIKDYESWTRKGEPRLTQTELGYCRSARDSALAYVGSGRPKSAPSDRNNLGNTSTEDRNSFVTGGVPESLRDRNSLGTESVPESLRSEAPPYRNAGAELKKREEEKTTQENVDVLKFGSLKEESCPAYPEGDGGMWDISPGKFTMPEKQARAIFRMIWNGWSEPKLCFEFYQYQRHYSDAVWIAALRKAKAQGKAFRSINYILTIATDYQANGIPAPKANAAFMAEPSRPKREMVFTVAPAHFVEHFYGNRSSDSA